MRLLHSLLLAGLVAACAALPETEPAPLAEVPGGTTAHTYDSNGTPVPDATVDDLAFLAGRWVGEGFGGVVEENWNPPLNDLMVGTFRLASPDGGGFFELMTIAEHEGRMKLRLKHFQPDLTPWEEGADTVDFPLVKVEGTTAWFGGLTLHRDGDHLLIYLAMRQGEDVNEVDLRFVRQ